MAWVFSGLVAKIERIRIVESVVEGINSSNAVMKQSSSVIVNATSY